MTHSGEMSGGKLSTVKSLSHCTYNAIKLSSYDSVLLTLDIKITQSVGPHFVFLASCLYCVQYL